MPNRNAPSQEQRRATIDSAIASFRPNIEKLLSSVSRSASLSRESTSGAVEAIRQIAERMQEINGNTTAVAASVEQQNLATGELSRSVTSAAEGTNHVVAVLGEVAGTATQKHSSAEVVRDASEAVERAVADLRLEVEDFLGKVAV